MPELKLQQSRLDGRYDIVECLGRGSYAEIYVARDNAAADGAPQTVVIKALNLFLQDTPDAELERTLVTNFQNEAVALDRVRHPHIISRLGHGTAIDLEGTEFHYLVLEYLPGGDMSALARKGALSMEKTLFYLEQVCSGLAHAHKGGVIHRDIKPQNLLLTADRRILKIADFGVARLESGEGAITRVGTNIYSAPEHNPLVQTGQLETASLVSSRELTPAADIYSLAKTTYTLLAGESPRRFAHHAITELPASLTDFYWAEPVRRVLEKATRSRPAERYQTVEDFWEDFAEATLPKTQPLVVSSVSDALISTPSLELKVDTEEFTKAAPPQPSFDTSSSRDSYYIANNSLKRPRIVVPINQLEGALPSPVPSRNGKSRIATTVADATNVKQGGSRTPSPPRRALVAAILLLAFSGMLLATHKYVTSHWNPTRWVPQLEETFVVGREGVTTTDVNLRADASTTEAPIGLAELGSRVKVLSTNNNWYEIQVVTHGRSKTDPFSSDRGWINKKFVKFD